MIIQCEQCQTRFRLDDSKVTTKGVKVRCAKCRHVFSVRKEEPEPESSDIGPSLEQSAVAEEQTDSVKSTVSEAQEPTSSFSFDNDLTEEKVDSDFQVQDNSSSLQEEHGFAMDQVQEPFSQDEVSFSDFDFGDTGTEAESTMSEAASETINKEKSQGLDFSDDDMFGAVVPPVTDDPGDSISFDFGTDSFADSMDMDGSDSGRKESSGVLESTGDAPFSLGEIDFGDELTAVAVQQVNPEELKPSQEILFAPLAEAREKPADDDEIIKAFMGEPATGQDELPPLSISSRRKQSSLFTGLITVAALLLVGVLGYFGFSTFMSDKGSVAQETGKISVRAIKASYVPNAAIGMVLVISGEALNEYTKPRAALQVKGTILDAAGQVLATKIAYCGNPLTNEQLQSLPQDKIEAAMSNQFGDSLANLEVSAGKVVPFTIVIINPPKDGKDFAVEAVGSTVATSK